MNKATFNALEIRAVGDTLYKCGCRNPYRALLTATAQGHNPQEIEHAYVRRSLSAELNDSQRTLLLEFDSIVKESTQAIDSLSTDNDGL